MAKEKLTVAWGAGGEYGIGFNMGAADALAGHGIDLQTIPHLGTSAGAWTAGMLVTGTSYEEASQLETRSIHDRAAKECGALQRYAEELFCDKNTEAGNVRATVYRLGALTVDVMSNQEYRLQDIVAASGAVPGIFAPVEIDGRKYWDGGVGGSMTNAHLAQDADALLVTAPMAFAPECSLARAPLLRTMIGGAVFGNVMKERLIWQFGTRGESAAIMPDRETSQLLRSPDDFFDRRVATEAYQRTYDGVSARLEDENDMLRHVLSGAVLSPREFPDAA